jgi:ABC-type taurine transport system substrate-binding protein
MATRPPSTRPRSPRPTASTRPPDARRLAEVRFRRRRHRLIAGGSLTSARRVSPSPSRPPTGAVETIFIADPIRRRQATRRSQRLGHRSRDLAGKTVAVPFSSRPRFATATVWDPALGAIKTSGTVLASSTDVGAWGAPTFDAWIARKDFAAENPDIVTGFARVTGGLCHYSPIRRPGYPDKANVDKIVNLTGAKPRTFRWCSPATPSDARARCPAYLGGDTIKAIVAGPFLKKGPGPGAADYGPT